MPTYRLDSVDGLATFLRAANNTLWLVRSTATTTNNPIEMVNDPAAWKEELMLKAETNGEDLVEIKKALQDFNNKDGSSDEI